MAIRSRAADTTIWYKRGACDIWISSSCSANIFYHNFLTNRSMVQCENGRNTWDNGYPSGGNYWRDYAAEDLHKGFAQNEVGNDGVWDYSYVIDENNMDRYPLIDAVWSGKKVHNIDIGLSYLTIQEAIDASSTMGGHTTKVNEGFRYEHVTLNKSVKLIGENANTTIIDGHGTGTVVTMASSNARLSNFTIQNNEAHGVLLRNASNSVLRNNFMNDFGIEIWLDSPLSYFIHDIDTSNTVAGKPFYYWVNKHGVDLPPDAGVIAVVNSTNVGIGGVKIAQNSQGILIAYTESSVIRNVALLDNENGILLHHSFNNTVAENYIGNNLCGIKLVQSSNNRIFHNNFVNNTWQIQSGESSNDCDDGYQGNYWSDYTESDTNGDGIGDLPYTIDVNNTDRYPLIKPYPWQASASLANRVISVLPMITKPVTCCIELRYSYSVYDIDAASILIDDTIRVDSSLPIMIGDLDLEGILGIQVSFKKEEIISNTLKNLNLTDDADSIEVNLKITGRLNYGQPFAATATIKIFFLGNGIAGVFLR